MNGLSPGKYVPSSPICTDPFSSKYSVQEDIGRGKFAVVKRCINLETGEVVAAKFIRKRRKGKSCREEILREVVMLELAMAHPRLVSLREVFETQSELILVTEYCSGGELFNECVINQSFKEDDVRRLLVQILEGLAYLHDKNIVHLDLKPQNILLTKPFPGGEVKICDLGFACLTNTGEDIRDIIGTPDYVAPEVLDYESLNIQTDMWSLGVLTYVMLTTCSPFAGDNQQETFCNITQVKLDFPDDLFGHINPLAKDFIEKLLVKKPRDRMTARQCLDHLWLKDLKQTMSINVPSPDHTKELASEMAIPSNWHMSPDRRSSTSEIEVGQAANIFPGPSSTLRLSEEKDLISKTLSHIEIDRSSSTSFETCPESIYGSPQKISSETLFVDSLQNLSAVDNLHTLSTDVYKQAISESISSDFYNNLAQIETSRTLSISENGLKNSYEFCSASSFIPFDAIPSDVSLSASCLSDKFNHHSAAAICHSDKVSHYTDPVSFHKDKISHHSDPVSSHLDKVCHHSDPGICNLDKVSQYSNPGICHLDKVSHHSDPASCHLDKVSHYSDLASCHLDKVNHYSDLASCHLDKVSHHSDPASCHLDKVSHHSDPASYHLDKVSHHSDPVSCHLDKVSHHSDAVSCHLDKVSHHSDPGICHSDKVSLHSDKVSLHSDKVSHHSDPASCHSKAVHDSNKMEVLNKRMSMEIPTKKAKCLQDMDDAAPDGNVPLAHPEQLEADAYLREQDIHDCNGLDDVRNSV
ncbi:serine/threonine-protein kinase 17A isoform X2 [Biomphalaria glabrata]|nr:serine/threonine-protein kinase 17A isoform X2 [Biomphalaria glabrata]